MTLETKKRIARRRLRRKKIKKEQQSLFFDLPKGLLILSVIMILAQLLVSNIIGVKGAELVQLEEEQEALLHEKMTLENEISRLSSLSRVERESRNKLSMTSAEENIIYVEMEIFASR